MSATARLDCVVTRALAFGIDRQVVIWAQRQSDAPVRHRQFWIELRGTRERPPRFVVVESINQLQSLIEKLLGLLVLSRNRMMYFAKARN